MASTRPFNGKEQERPSKRAKVASETDLAEGNAVDANLENLDREREESPVSDGEVEDTTKAAQGSDLYLDTVRMPFFLAFS